MNAAVWQPISGIEGPCADISFAYSAGHCLTVTMHFSHVIGLPNRDLRVRFPTTLAMHWEDEFPGFYPIPQNTARCSDPRWSTWVFPLHKVEGSTVLEQFRGLYDDIGISGICHFVLISMNDLVHVIAHDDATAEWIEGTAHAESEA